MTTVKEFETKKNDIIEIIEIAESYMYDIQEGMTASDISYEMGHVSVRLARARQEIKDLKILTRPTCASCKHWINENLKINDTDVYPHKTCDNLKMWDSLKIGSDKNAKLVFINPTKDHGCIHHSEYDEVKND